MLRDVILGGTLHAKGQVCSIIATAQEDALVQTSVATTANTD
jgi:hypothetical protein